MRAILTLLCIAADVGTLSAGPPQHPARPPQHPPCETRQVWVIDGRPTEVWVTEPASTVGSYHPDGSWTWPAQAAFAPQAFGVSGGCAGGACGGPQSYAPARRGVFRR